MDGLCLVLTQWFGVECGRLLSSQRGAGHSSVFQPSLGPSLGNVRVYRTQDILKRYNIYCNCNCVVYTNIHYNIQICCKILWIIITHIYIYMYRIDNIYIHYKGVFTLPHPLWTFGRSTNLFGFELNLQGVRSTFSRSRSVPWYCQIA